MLLAIEVGNTTTVLAVSDAGGGPWTSSWRVASDPRLTADDWSAKAAGLALGTGLDLAAVDAVAVSSVVPAITTTVVRWSETRLGIRPLVVDATVDVGMPLLVEAPGELGADRICNAVAAWDRARAAAVVVDTGTATKVEAVSAAGEYLGGAIAVGLALSLEALAQRAARLYSVPLVPSPRVIGKYTDDSVQSGIVQGHGHMVDGLVGAFREELGDVRRVFLTGGYSGILAPLLRTVTDHEPDLTLDGLRLIHRRNPSRPV